MPTLTCLTSHQHRIMATIKGAMGIQTLSRIHCLIIRHMHRATDMGRETMIIHLMTQIMAMDHQTTAIQLERTSTQIRIQHCQTMDIIMATTFLTLDLITITHRYQIMDTDQIFKPIPVNLIFNQAKRTIKETTTIPVQPDMTRIYNQAKSIRKVQTMHSM